MDKIEKLLLKISKKDRMRILVTLKNLRMGNLSGLEIQKVKRTHFYRIRVGVYRVIFHYDYDNEIQIDAVRHRNEDTYKNL